VVFARFDVRVLFADAVLGPQLNALAQSLVPVGDGTWFIPGRDIDRATVAVYATPEAEVASVLSGRFDVDRLMRATRARSGAFITSGSYGGFLTSTTGRMTWAAVTPRTVVAGTPEGVHWVLDRLQRGAPEHSLPPWISDTLATPAAAAALTADFVSQPLASASLGNFNLPWIKGMRIVRVLGNLEPPGLNVAATVTYADPSLAQQATGAVLSADRWLELVGPLVGGAKLRGFTADAQGSDLRCKFAIDTQGLASLLTMVERFLPVPAPSLP
jgi:hypothetical protein